MMTAHQQNITQQQQSTKPRWAQNNDLPSPDDTSCSKHAPRTTHPTLQPAWSVSDSRRARIITRKCRHSIKQLTFSNKTKAILLEVNQTTTCTLWTTYKKQATSKNVTKTKTNIELHERSHDLANIRNCDLHTNRKEPPTQPKIKQKQYTNKPSKWQSHIS